ncbi:hypothetical protein EB151_10310, partial [archaeon]|nr:hypothetical protein [archaeon]
MATFQIRRGGSSAKGTLAYGEPYLNADSQSIVFGASGSEEITLVKLNRGASSNSKWSGSLANSGSLSLTGDITASNAYFAGNVFVSGNIKIGDQTSDVITVVATLSGSLTPDQSTLYDIGSSAYKWRKLFLQSASIDHIENLGNVSNISSSFASLNEATLSLYSYTASNDSTNTTQNNRLNNLETASGSLNSYTSSNNTNITRLFATASDHELRIQANEGILSTHAGRLLALQSFSASVIATGSIINTFTSSVNTSTSSLNYFSASVIATGSIINTFTSSVNTFTESVNASGSIINTFTSSVNSFTASVIATGSLINTFTSSVNTSTSSLNAFSASVIATGSIINTFTSSVNSYTASNNTNISAIHISTSSLNSYTASNDTKIANLSNYTSSLDNAIQLTGSNLTVKGDLLVKGTTTTINSTTVDIGDNIISLNGSAASNGGLIVRDAGGTTTSGSLLWDTALDYWKAGANGAEERIILETRYNIFSSSINTRAENLEAQSASFLNYTSSINSYTASNNTTNNTQNNRLTALETASGSLNSYT